MSTEAPEAVFLVPFGAVLPAAALAFDDEVSPEQEFHLNEILEEFVRRAYPTDPAPVSDYPPSGEFAGPGTETASHPRVGQPSDEWPRALDYADQLYRSIHGVEAFNAKSIRSAIEALSEKNQNTSDPLTTFP